MNAVVLDGVRLGDGVVVAAGSVVAPKAEVAARKVVMGVPGAVVGDLPAGMQRAGEDEDYVSAIPMVPRPPNRGFNRRMQRLVQGGRS